MKDYETERRASDRESCMYDASIVRGLLFDAIGALHGRYTASTQKANVLTVSSISHVHICHQHHMFTDRGIKEYIFHEHFICEDKCLEVGPKTDD